ncbi:MAG TPA: helix-turn-helix domain-containing protein [Chloroflexota bacterium]
MKVATRRYDNSLREVQAEQTRERILEGLVRTMARGVAELSFPAVAKEAGVSLRTVYRYFPTKRELLAGLVDHAYVRVGPVHEPRPRSAEDLADQVKQAFLVLDGMDDTLRAAYASALGRDFRHDVERPLKHWMFAEALAPVTASLPEPDRTYLLRIVQALGNRHTLRVFRDDLDLSAEEAGDTVAWLIRNLPRLAEGLRRADGRRADGDVKGS